MASFASSATTGGARKHAWTKMQFLIYKFSYIIIYGKIIWTHKMGRTTCQKNIATFFIFGHFWGTLIYHISYRDILWVRIYQKKSNNYFRKIPSYKACMSTYKLKKHIKTKKIKHFKIPFFGHQLLPQWYTAAYSVILLISHSVNQSFCYSVILLLSHFVIPSLCYLVILLLSHYVTKSFCFILLLSLLCYRLDQN